MTDLWINYYSITNDISSHVQSDHTENILQFPEWNCLQRGHLSDIIVPLKAELDGEVPNLEGYGVFKVCEELTESVPDPDELLEDLELWLFLDDCPDRNSNPFLFEIFLETFFH